MKYLKVLKEEVPSVLARVMIVVPVALFLRSMLPGGLDLEGFLICCVFAPVLSYLLFAFSKPHRDRIDELEG